MFSLESKKPSQSNRRISELRFIKSPIIYSDECEISFSDVIQVDRNISDYDATSASLRIPYNLQAKYQREVWKGELFILFYLFMESISNTHCFSYR
jgi:hypothetical protein